MERGKFAKSGVTLCFIAFHTNFILYPLPLFLVSHYLSTFINHLRVSFPSLSDPTENPTTNNPTTTTSSNLPLPTSNGGPYTGDLTYYDPGLGSCGIESTASENICAVSHVVFDAALISGNPNENPLCGLRLRIRRGDRSVDVKVVDRCPGCNVDDLDVSPAVFKELGHLDEGRVLVDWSWLDETPISMG
ncbi:RlpA-like double-psi beta-barrel-protein domain-containing protein-containing protein [Aspergillus karnatakaensis]|uniref:RlpA-like double-psi beta-barrel domain-containing protein n=1 Tax=Aspergillus karnatakaensis TaxID=1810916 RepID=UPI003CCDAB9B